MNDLNEQKFLLSFYIKFLLLYINLNDEVFRTADHISHIIFNKLISKIYVVVTIVYELA